MFGKVGRPAEDRFARQCEIFEAVAPLILSVGARRLTMSQAARAACLSIGGLYHYFSTKRDLLLFTLQPETLDRRCQNFHREHRELAARDPERYLDLFVDFVVQGVRLWQPGIQAALELGVETFWEVLDAAMRMGSERFREMKRVITPGVSEDTLDQLEYSVRRAALAACLDKQITPETLRSEIHVIFRGYAADAHRRQVNEEGVPLAIMAVR